jgi:predicted HTH domain antitoxin
MAEITIHYPPGLEETVRATPEEVEQQILLMAALKMFELGKLSSGKAAELAGLSRPDFFEACSRYKVSIMNIPANEIEMELRQDLESALKMAGQ